MVHLALPLDEARRRASTRTVHLTDDEFDLLHGLMASPPHVDVVLDVGRSSVDQQTDAIRRAWESASRPARDS